MWRAWGIRATAEDRREDIRNRFKSRARETMLDYGPLAVWVFSGSRAHHLASLGLWWLALLVARASDTRPMPWAERNNRDMDQSPLMVAVVARRPVGRGPDGKVEWAHALGDREVARMVRAAVGLGADVDERTQRAWPLMTYCAGRGCLEAVKACLAAGAEVDAPGSDGFWETVHAGRGGHKAVVEALLEAGASARRVVRDVVDRTLAAMCGGRPTPGIVRRLAEAGADVNAVDDRGYSALHCAAFRGNVAVVEALVDLGAEVGVTIIMDAHGRTPIHEAANGDVVRLLAGRGASVQGKERNLSPLQIACFGGRVDVVRALIELGADIHHRSIGAETAFHVAVRHDNVEMVEQQAVEMTRLLLAAGADPKAANVHGCMPLHVASHAACVDLLLDTGAVLEARDIGGRTPICVAATTSPLKAEAVLRMADRGADHVNPGGEPGLVKRIVAGLQAKRSGSQLG